jgi:xylulokinase
MEYILAHDVGTTGTKAVLVSPSGEVAATAYAPYPTSYPRPLWAEQDPADWWKAVGQTARAVLDRAQVPASAVMGLTFATQMLDIIALDAQRELLGTCISWLDCRAGEEARWVMGRLGGPSIFAALVGATITGKDMLPKYVWLKRHAPEVYARTKTFIDCTGYLMLRATGRLVFEWTTASVTGLFDLKSKSWDTGLMRFFGLERSKFPDLVGSTSQVGGLTAEAARELGLREGTPVIAGAGDGPCAAVGAGAVGEGEGHMCLGTSGIVGVMTRRKVTGKRGLATIQSTDAAKNLLIGEMETCGECLNWGARVLYGREADAAAFSLMDADVDATPPGAGGLLFAPWMYGERCPVSDERARAGFINLGANHSRREMTRAIYEGVAFNLRWILESVQSLYGFACPSLRVIGGGAKGRPWLRIIADVTGRQLEPTLQPQEAAAVGAALVGGVGLGLYPTIEATRNVIRPSQVVAPDNGQHEAYTQAYRAFQSLYPSLRGLFHTLNRGERTAA